MTFALQPLIAKELRALLPVWGACAASLVLASVPGEPKLYVVALLAYTIGAIALGALSLGHEYTGATLGLLLSQPIGRGRLLLVKTAVVAAMLVALAGVAWASLFNGRAFHLGFHDADGAAPHVLALLILPALAGLCITPVLTMMCRSPMAGGVFTGTAMGAIWLAAQAFTLFTDGQLQVGGSSLDVLQLPLVWGGTLALSALATLAGWRRFARLEAIEGRGQDVRLPRWRAAPTGPVAFGASTGARHPLWQLARKELHLQQMTLVVAALYVLCWAAISAVRPMMPEDIARRLDALVFLYAPLMALLAGSLASAEERQFGTLEWQVLLPIAASHQWLVKAGTAIALALLLALGLPALLETIYPSGMEMKGAVPRVGPLILVLVSIGLYVSTFSATGIRAMLLSIPVTLLVVVAAGAAAWALYALPWERLGSSVDWLPLHTPESRKQFVSSWLAVGRWQPLILATIFAALALRFGLANHRSSERRLGRVWKHAVVTGAAVFLAVFLFIWYFQMVNTIIYRDYRARRGAEAAAATPARPPGELAPAPDRQFVGGWSRRAPR